MAQPSIRCSVIKMNCETHPDLGVIFCEFAPEWRLVGLWKNEEFESRYRFGEFFPVTIGRSVREAGWCPKQGDCTVLDLKRMVSVPEVIPL